MRKALTLLASAGLILSKGASFDDCGCDEGTSSVQKTNSNEQNAALYQKLAAGQQAQCASTANQNVARAYNAGLNQAISQVASASSEDIDNKNEECKDHEASGQESRARSGKSCESDSKLKISNHKSKEGELHVAEGLDRCGKVKTIEEMDEEVELAEHVQSEKDLKDNEKICRKKWVKRKHNRKAYKENCGAKKAGKIVKKKKAAADKVDNQKFDGSHNRGGLAVEQKAFIDIDRKHNSDYKNKDADNIASSSNANASAFLKAANAQSADSASLDFNNAFFTGDLKLGASQDINNNQKVSSTNKDSC
jgi:hypothetical protein